MSTKQNKLTVQRALDHFNRGDLEAYLDLYADDAAVHGLGIEPGIDHIRRFYRDFNLAFHDAEVTIHEMLAEDDRVTCRYTFRGTHRGPLMGIPATGKAVALDGISILRFAGGRCVERWAQADYLGLMQQLGAVPQPGAAPADLAARTRTVYALFSDSAFDRVLEHAAEDVEVHFVPAGQTFHGHEGLLAFMQGFKAAFPDISIDVTNQVVAGDQVVSQFRAQGRQTGPLQTPAGVLPPTGRPAAWDVCEVWRFREGKLASIHNYQDSATMLRQLGHLPEAAPA